MRKRQEKTYTIVKSCITGRAVWIYYGSKDYAKLAYKKACRKEIERIRNWKSIVEKRREGILRFLSDCTASVPLTGEMTPEQLEGAREIQAIARQDPPLYKDFYDHIVEEFRRRNEASKRWREHRLRLLGVDEIEPQL